MSAIVDAMMNERVRMLGFPQIIVTRGFMYQWLKKHAAHLYPDRTGFASLDCACFGGAAVKDELTATEDRDSLLNAMLAKETMYV